MPGTGTVSFQHPAIPRLTAVKRLRSIWRPLKWSSLPACSGKTVPPANCTARAGTGSRPVARSAPDGKRSWSGPTPICSRLFPSDRGQVFEIHQTNTRIAMTSVSSGSNADSPKKFRVKAQRRGKCPVHPSVTALERSGGHKKVLNVPYFNV